MVSRLHDGRGMSGRDMREVVVREQRTKRNAQGFIGDGRERCGCEGDWGETQVQHFRCVCPSRFLLRCRWRKLSFLIEYREGPGKLEAINQGALIEGTEDDKRPQDSGVGCKLFALSCSVRRGPIDAPQPMRRGVRNLRTLESSDELVLLAATKKNTSFLPQFELELLRRIRSDSSRRY